MGKTTAVDLFAKEFDQYIYLNLEKKEDGGCLMTNIHFLNFLMLSFLLKMQKKIREKPFFLLMKFKITPNAVSKLRFFYEEGKTFIRYCCRLSS